MKHTEHIPAYPEATVLVLSGNPQVLSEHVRRSMRIASVSTVAADERMIRRFREMLRHVKEASASPLVCFGCKDLELQRFQFFLKGYLLFSRTASRGILDEQGRYVKVTYPAFLLFDVPRFLFELAASIVVVIVTSIRLTATRASLQKNTRKNSQ